MLIYLEIVRFGAMFAVIVAIVWFGFFKSRRQDTGITFILVGFILLLIGSLVDVADDYKEFAVLAELMSSNWAEFVEKEIGYLGGVVCLAVGFWIWLPKTQALAEEIVRRKKTEAILVQSQKMEAVGQLTGGIAHDFNNLLAVILGNLELLRDTQKQQKDLERIDASIGAAQKGAELTRNMLSFASQAPLASQKINLNQVVEKTINWVERTVPENIEIKMSLSADIREVEADLASTESAILNLILNAQAAMPNGGKLTIETANIVVDNNYVLDLGDDCAPGRYAMIAVSDTGVGIPHENLETIFEPFFTTKAVGAGSGLGLSMIHGFMKQTGGAVHVYSEKGQGTTFKLYFPAKQKRASFKIEKPKSHTSDLSGNGIRVLVAEDEPAVMNVICEMLSNSGYTVLKAYSGDEALALFEQEPNVDILLTDVVMPGELQGPGLMKKLRTINPDLPAVFMSGYASEATVHGNGLRPDDVRLMKPIPKNELLKALEKVRQGQAVAQKQD